MTTRGTAVGRDHASGRRRLCPGISQVSVHLTTARAKRTEMKHRRQPDKRSSCLPMEAVSAELSLEDSLVSRIARQRLK